MVVSFSNSFFSLSGQAERLSNAGSTILAAVTGKGVTSNTGVNVIDKVLGAAASNPFITAAAGAVAVNPAGAVAAVKAVSSSISSSFSAASTATKAKVLIGTGLIAPAVIANPLKAAEAVSKAPSSVINIEKNLVSFYKEPSLSSAATVFKENPVVTGLIGAAGVAAVGVGIGAAGSIASNLVNTQATKANTAAVSASTLSSIGGGINPAKMDIQNSNPVLPAQSSKEISPASLTSTPLSTAGKTGISKTTNSTKRRGKRAKHRQRMAQNRNLYIQQNFRSNNGKPSKCYNFY